MTDSPTLNGSTARPLHVRASGALLGGHVHVTLRVGRSYAEDPSLGIAGQLIVGADEWAELAERLGVDPASIDGWKESADDDA